jgi:hypothetical protein
VLRFEELPVDLFRHTMAKPESLVQRMTVMEAGVDPCQNTSFSQSLTSVNVWAVLVTLLFMVSFTCGVPKYSWTILATAPVTQPWLAGNSG